MQPTQAAAVDCLHWAPITDLHWLPGFKVPRPATTGAPDRSATVGLLPAAAAMAAAPGARPSLLSSLLAAAQSACVGCWALLWMKEKRQTSTCTWWREPPKQAGECMLLSCSWPMLTRPGTKAALGVPQAERTTRRCSTFATAAVDGRVQFWDVSSLGRQRQRKAKQCALPCSRACTPVHSQAVCLTSRWPSAASAPLLAASHPLLRWSCRRCKGSTQCCTCSKDRPEEEDNELRPVYVAPLLSVEGTDLPVSRLCFLMSDASYSQFLGALRRALCLPQAHRLRGAHPCC